MNSFVLAPVLTEELESKLRPLHEDRDVFLLGEGAKLLEPERVHEPVHCHVRLHAAPAQCQDFSECAFKSDVPSSSFLRQILNSTMGRATLREEATQKVSAAVAHYHLINLA